MSKFPGIRNLAARLALGAVLLGCGWVNAAVGLNVSAPAPAARAESSITVLGELTPSRRLASGEAVEALGFERKSEFTLTLLSALPIEEVAEAVGLPRLHWAFRSGGYERAITPNLVVDVAASAERLSAFALAWMYVYRQDSVPFFETSGAGRPGIRITFAKELTVEREAAMFAELVRALGPEAGYTRVGDREILIIDFEDAGFAALLGRFSELMAGSNPVVAREAFAAQCAFPSHDWAVDPEGAGLMVRLRASLSPQAEAQLRELHARYAALVSAWLAGRDRVPDAPPTALTRP